MFRNSSSVKSSAVRFMLSTLAASWVSSAATSSLGLAWISPAGIPDSSSQSATKSLSSSSGDTSRANVVSGRSLGAQKTVTSIVLWERGGGWQKQDQWTNPVLLQQNAVSVVPCVTQENTITTRIFRKIETCMSVQITSKIESNVKSKVRHCLDSVGERLMWQFLF